MIKPVLVLACLMVFVVALPAFAHTSHVRRICVRSATLHDTPRGFVIARLYRRQRVTIMARSAERGWTAVRTSTGLPGWILSRSLCRG